MAGKMIVVHFCSLLLIASLTRTGWTQGGVYVSAVRVSEPTRLDWRYPSLGSSPEKVPKDLGPSFTRSRQSYEYYGPRTRTVQALPLVIFISPADTPTEWKYWRRVCQRHGIIYAGVREVSHQPRFHEF